MTLKIEFLEEAVRDMENLDHSVQVQVMKGILKVKQNPLSSQHGGYGKPLGHRNGTNLTNLYKIKFQNPGIRVVYKTEHIEGIMKIIIVSARTDEQVYREAEKRREKHDL